MYRGLSFSAAVRLQLVAERPARDSLSDGEGRGGRMGLEKSKVSLMHGASVFTAAFYEGRWIRRTGPESANQGCVGGPQQTALIKSSTANICCLGCARTTKLPVGRK